MDTSETTVGWTDLKVEIGSDQKIVTTLMRSLELHKYEMKH